MSVDCFWMTRSTQKAVPSLRHGMWDLSRGMESLAAPSLASFVQIPQAGKHPTVCRYWGERLGATWRIRRLGLCYGCD